MKIEITDKQRRIILQALIEYEQDTNRYLFRQQMEQASNKYFKKQNNNEEDIDLVRLEEFANNIKATRRLFDI